MTKMTHEELEKRILDMLADVCGDDAVRDPSLRDADLFEEGFLDSMAAVELLLDIEDELGVSIELDQSVTTMKDLIAKIEEAKNA